MPQRKFLGATEATRVSVSNNVQRVIGVDSLGAPIVPNANGGYPSSDAGPAWTTSRGVAGARFTSSDQHNAVASITDTPASGKKLVITDLLISSDTDMRLDLSVESDATVIETFYITANQTVQFTPRGKWKLATADKKLQVKSSVAGNISITAFYYSEA